MAARALKIPQSSPAVLWPLFTSLHGLVQAVQELTSSHDMFSGLVPVPEGQVQRPEFDLHRHTDAHGAPGADHEHPILDQRWNCSVSGVCSQFPLTAPLPTLIWPEANQRDLLQAAEKVHVTSLVATRSADRKQKGAELTCSEDCDDHELAPHSKSRYPRLPPTQVMAIHAIWSSC